MSISIRGVSRQFGTFHALRNVDLEIPTGQFIALLGPSGSGKTTLLRILAGLERPDAGSILFAGEDATDRAARERGVGFVFQHYALFRHMTVFENVAFGLRVRPKAQRPEEAAIRERVHELLRLVQLEGLSGRSPSQLSGGQRQRVALARALAVEPRVLLLDEPFGALDARVRVELRRWLRELHEQLNVTSIIVTHDQEEALELADRVVVMNHGQVEQIGSPTDLWDHPANPFVLEFLGDVNQFQAQAKDGRAQIGQLDIEVPDALNGRLLQIGVRSFDLKFWHDPAGNANVTRVVALADRVRVDAQLVDGPAIFAQFPRRSSLLRDIVPGARVNVEITHAHVYPVGENGAVETPIRVRPRPVAAE